MTRTLIALTLLSLTACRTPASDAGWVDAVDAPPEVVSAPSAIPRAATTPAVAAPQPAPPPPAIRLSLALDAPDAPDAPNAFDGPEAHGAAGEEGVPAEAPGAASEASAVGSTRPAPGGARRGPPGRRGGIRLSLTALGVEQLRTDLGEGGRFEVSRFFVQPRVSYGSRDLQLSLGLGVGLEDYRFRGDRGLAGLDPWDEILGLDLSGFVRWRFSGQNTLFAIPTLRVAGEPDVDVCDALSGGALVGVARRVSDTLTIGGGLGVISEIEDSPSVFPILLIDWKITEQLTLRTGRGTAASRGPGLTLEYAFREGWALEGGGRYESRRFRLDDEGVAPDGVGEDTTAILFATLSRRWKGGSRISLLAGVDLDGRLRLEDEDGDVIARERYDAAPFVGLSAELRF